MRARVAQRRAQHARVSTVLELSNAALPRSSFVPGMMLSRMTPDSSEMIMVLLRKVPQNSSSSPKGNEGAVGGIGANLAAKYEPPRTPGLPAPAAIASEL